MSCKTLILLEVQTSSLYYSKQAFRMSIYERYVRLPIQHTPRTRTVLSGQEGQTTRRERNLTLANSGGFGGAAPPTPVASPVPSPPSAILGKVTIFELGPATARPETSCGDRRGELDSENLTQRFVPEPRRRWSLLKTEQARMSCACSDSIC